MEIVDTLGFLLGTWKAERSIEDHRSGISGVFSGTASLVTRPNDRSGPARYDETGELRLGTWAGPASRHLGYTRLAGTSVLLSFADGRPFVELDLAGGAWESVHDCVEDRYEMATTVLSADIVEERWRVRGPDKDYDAVTTLTRVPATTVGRSGPRTRRVRP